MVRATTALRNSAFFSLQERPRQNPPKIRKKSGNIEHLAGSEVAWLPHMGHTCAASFAFDDGHVFDGKLGVRPWPRYTYLNNNQIDLSDLWVGSMGSMGMIKSCRNYSRINTV
ncbi:hypothetical protein Zmor_019872 [Zophobas morio]|uniref:Uncharacterized protein n=1 Tax=Zophobas morio TaxID=2755281 RepID=A0AA38M9D4_9CUCU|nr:hypothetical protein Zmor_019872 [Zophobas morio]